MTSHPWRLASVFAVCLTIALAAAGWLTVLIFRLDEAQLEARHSADIEGRVRLALWRMDSAIAPLVAQENARPYFVLEPFYSLEAAASYDTANPSNLVPSPLLAEAGHDVLLHFQVRHDGRLTSPQVPTGPLRELAAERYVRADSLRAAERRLHDLATWLKVPRLLAELPAGESGSPTATALVVKAAPGKTSPRPSGGAEYRRRLLVLNQNMASQQLLQTQLNPRTFATRAAGQSSPPNPLAPPGSGLAPADASPLFGGGSLDALSYLPTADWNSLARTPQLQVASTRPLEIVGEAGLLASGNDGGETGIVVPSVVVPIDGLSGASAGTQGAWWLTNSLPPLGRSTLVLSGANFGPLARAMLYNGGPFATNSNFDANAGGGALLLGGNANTISLNNGGNTVTTANAAPTTNVNATANISLNGGALTLNSGTTSAVNGAMVLGNSSVPTALAWNVAGNATLTNDYAAASYANYWPSNAGFDGNVILGANTYTGSTTISQNSLSQNSALQNPASQSGNFSDSQTQNVNWGQTGSLQFQGNLTLQGNNRQMQQRGSSSSVAQNRYLNPTAMTAQNRGNAQSQTADAPNTSQLATKAGDPAAQTVVTTGMMTPVWIGDHLLLARRVSSGSNTYLQGCWLDWSSIQAELKSLTEDLLPGLELEPVRAPGGAEHERMLATLPVRLLPGKLLAADVAHSPLRLSLLPAWIGIVLAAIAAAALLAGILALSERRAAFVSAVTHEMRTPLTTFRMYAEMLAEGMVPDEAQRREYLETLRGEADRLAHLVENVLAYAQLERTASRTRGEQLTLAALVDRAAGRLRTRSAQAGLELIVEFAPAAADARLWVDASAVEQVLFNLVDNACKYAQAATDRRLLLSASTEHGLARLELRDHGPGIEQSQARRLFRPFSKTDRQAARTAPGVGLGLALSRRLARAMGGDLQLAPCDDPGAAFVLTLPLDPPRSPLKTA